MNVEHMTDAELERLAARDGRKGKRNDRGVTNHARHEIAVRRADRAREDYIPPVLRAG